MIYYELVHQGQLKTVPIEQYRPNTKAVLQRIIFKLGPKPVKQKSHEK